MTTLSQGQLCPALKHAFGPLDCETPQTSFTTLPNDRFSHATAYQYFTPLESLAPLITYAKGTLCPDPSPSSTPDDASSCDARVDRLTTASSLDVSYDTISHALKVTATWAHQPQVLSVSAPPEVAKNHRVEVGVLAATSAGDQHPGGLIEPHEIGMGGVLTVLGQDKKPSPTVFKFPARHRRVEGDGAFFRAEVAAPAGLHPTLRLELGAAATVPPSTGDEGGACALHAYLTLPRAVFADRYQLADPLFLASRNLSALRWLSQPVDLEAPDYVLSQWGSAALFELAPPSQHQQPEEATASTAEVPLHLRYLRPAAGGYQTLEVPHPVVFWACTTEEGTKFPSSPFERVNLGYDGLFGPRTVFWHVDPAPAPTGAAADKGGRLVSEIRVPVLDADRAGWVGAGTAAAVLLGFGWIAWKLAQVYLRTGYGPRKQMEGLERKKEQ